MTSSALRCNLPKSKFLKNTTGNNNTALGTMAGFSSTGDGNVFLGYSAGYSETGSNRLHIGNNDSSTLIYGQFDTGKVCINCTNPSTAMDVNGQLTVRSWGAATATGVCKNGNTLSTCSSSVRYKERIEDLGLGLETVGMLRPVIFKWKNREEHDIGLVAEEVAEVEPLLVNYGEKGEIEGVKYPQLTAPLTKAVQELKVQNDHLKA